MAEEKLLSVLAVVLQILGLAAVLVGAAIFFDSAWAAVIVGGLTLFLVGDALERR